jgi:hypothetical protein
MKKMSLSSLNTHRRNVDRLRHIVKKQSERQEIEIDYSRYSFQYAAVNPDGSLNGPFPSLEKAMMSVGVIQPKINKYAIYESSALSFRAAAKDDKNRQIGKAAAIRHLEAALKELEEQDAIAVD